MAKNKRRQDHELAIEDLLRAHREASDRGDMEMAKLLAAAIAGHAIRQHHGF